jgi:hypothetical protein
MQYCSWAVVKGHTLGSLQMNTAHMQCNKLSGGSFQRSVPKPHGFYGRSFGGRGIAYCNNASTLQYSLMQGVSLVVYTDPAPLYHSGGSVEFHFSESVHMAPAHVQPNWPSRGFVHRWGAQAHRVLPQLFWGLVCIAKTPLCCNRV